MDGYVKVICVVETEKSRTAGDFVIAVGDNVCILGGLFGTAC